MSGIPIHLLNAGKYGAEAARWREFYPGLDTRIAFQIDAGSDGGLPRSADLDEIDWPSHLAAIDAKLPANPVMRADPGALVVYNWENHSNPAWSAIKSGEWDTQFLASALVWEEFCEGRLPAISRQRGFYLWPYRCPPIYLDRMKAAGRGAAWFFREHKCIMPSVYNKEPGDIVGDIIGIATAMAAARDLAEFCGGLPVIPQMNIRHVGGGFVALDEFRRDLEAVKAGGADAIALWSDARRPEKAAETSRAMLELGYADATLGVFGRGAAGGG